MFGNTKPESVDQFPIFGYAEHFIYSVLDNFSTLIVNFIFGIVENDGGYGFVDEGEDEGDLELCPLSDRALDAYNTPISQ